MEHPESAEVIQPSDTMYRIISYSLVACMITCATFTALIFIEQALVIANWQPTKLMGLYFMVALDSLISYRFSQRWTFLSQRSLTFLAQQSIFIIILSKIALAIAYGWDSFFKEIPTWQENFLGNFFNVEMVFTLSMAVLVWLASSNFAIHLEAIGPKHHTIDSNIPPRQELMELFFTLGTILIVLTLLSRIDLNQFLSNKRPETFTQFSLFEKGGASTLLYFIFGLILLNLTNFTSLRTSWYIQKTPVNHQLVAQWTAYSLLFTGILFLIINLLPTLHYTQPLLTIPTRNPQVLRTPQPATPIVQPQMPFPKEPLQKETVNPILINLSQLFETIKRIIAWVIIISMVILLIQQTLRDYQNILERIRNLPGWGWFVKFLIGVRNLFHHIRTTFSSILENSLESVSQFLPGQNQNGLINLRKLTPRQQIFFFYLAFTRRASEKGLPRSHAQTPSEYAAEIKSSLPSAANDIQALTAAFERARYSRQPIETEDSQRVESIWQRIRKMLRGRK